MHKPSAGPLCLGLLCVLGLTIQQALAEAKEDVLTVKQLNAAVGVTYIYISRDHAKLVARDGELTITCGAPKWNVLCHSRSDNAG
ncbi:MAG: hypothetical protein ACRD3W_17310, partial [Terriglobales bacterium]